MTDPPAINNSGKPFLVNVAAILEALPDALVISEVTGAIMLVNRQAELLFGRSASDLIGTQIESLMPERFRAAHGPHRADYYRDLRPRPMGTGLEVPILQRSGREVLVDIALSPLITDTGILILSAIRRVPGKSSGT